MAGVKEKLMTGVWCTRAPFGYDNVKRNSKKFIEINNNGKLIKKVLSGKSMKMYAIQLYKKGWLLMIAK